MPPNTKWREHREPRHAPLIPHPEPRAPRFVETLPPPRVVPRVAGGVHVLAAGERLGHGDADDVDGAELLRDRARLPDARGAASRMSDFGSLIAEGAARSAFRLLVVVLCVGVVVGAIVGTICARLT